MTGVGSVDFDTLVMRDVMHNAVSLRWAEDESRFVMRSVAVE